MSSPSFRYYLMMLLSLTLKTSSYSSSPSSGSFAPSCSSSPSYWSNTSLMFYPYTPPPQFNRIRLTSVSTLERSRSPLRSSPSSPLPQINSSEDYNGSSNPFSPLPILDLVNDSIFNQTQEHEVNPDDVILRMGTSSQCNHAEECFICRDETKKIMMRTPCNHIICESCLFIICCKHPICPFCKQSLI